MGLKFRRGTTAQQSGSLAFGEPYVNTTLGTLVVGGATGDIILSSGGTGSTGNFGAISGSGLDITGNANIAGNLTLGGAITIGDASADTVNVIASLSSSLIPQTSNAFDLGSATKIWRDLYISTGSIKFVEGTSVVKTLTAATLTALEAATGSSNTSITNLNSTTASLNTSVTNINLTTASLNTSVSNLNTFSGSENTKSTTLQTYTASIDTRLTEIGVVSGSLITSASAAKTTNDSQGVSITNINSTTASLNTSVTNLNLSSASQQVSIDNLNTFSGSANTRFTEIGVVSGSLITSASAAKTTNDSQGVSITNINTTTASLNTSVTNLNTYTSSLKTALSLSGADLTVLGNLTVQGDTTTLNTSNLLVEDKLIELAIGTTTSAGANGAGIFISGANASILWDDTNSTLDINKSIDIVGNITLTGNVDGVDVSVLNSNINTTTASLNTSVSNLNTFSGSANTRFTEIGVVSGSLITSASAAKTTNDSQGVSITNLNSATASLLIETANLETFSSSALTRLDNLEGKDISITLTGDVTGAGTITNLANVSFATTIAANSVALGTDTTGDYVASLVAGTNITLSNNSGEGATPTIGLTNNTISGISLGSNLGTLTIGTGLSGTSYNGSAAVTIANTGVTSLTAGTGVSVSGATGAVTISIGQAVATSSNVQFNSLGIGMAASATAGRIDATNDVVAFSSSDIRFKENIVPIENALDKISKISGNTYDWKAENKIEHGYEGNDVGVIAQEIEAVLPQLVQTRENGFKAVKYDKLVALLIEGIKEQQTQIEKLRMDLDNYECKCDNCKSK